MGGSQDDFSSYPAAINSLIISSRSIRADGFLPRAS